MFDRYSLDEDKENEIIKNLKKLMKDKNEKWIDDLPIYVTKDGKFEFMENEDAKID